MASGDLDPTFRQALKLLHATSADSTQQLKQLLYEAIRTRREWRAQAVSLEQDEDTHMVAPRDFPMSLAAGYKLGPTLGEGAYGIVYSGHRVRDNLPVAIKLISDIENVTMDVDEEYGRVPLEVKLLLRASGVPGVITFLEHFQSLQGLSLVFERLENAKDLFDFISDRGKLPECVARKIFGQVLISAQGCHDRGILHRDIKIENILVDTITLKAKLIDFGCATYLHNKPYHAYQGTLTSAPPEWFLQKTYMAENLTVWSLGIVLYAMVMGERLFEKVHDITRAQLHIEVDLTFECKDIIKCSLEPKPNRRVTLNDLSRHPWLGVD